MTAAHSEAVDSGVGEGLRERKKRLMHELLSTTATELFLTRGFAEVKVSDVANACGVSEKTVYNYFPTKESLLLDREEEMAADLRRALGPGTDRSPVEAMVGLIERDIDLIAGNLSSHALGDLAGLDIIRAFQATIESAPSLRAFHRDMMDRLVAVAAEALAARAGMAPSDPEPQIAAVALLGLYRVQWESLTHHAQADAPAAQVYAAVRRDVARAAKLMESGLWAFDTLVLTRQVQAQAAMDAAAQAKAQVQAAMREASKAWKDLRRAGREHDAAEKLRRRSR